MAGPFAKAFTSKRARDSPTPLASPPVLNATKIDEETADEEFKIPGFLRQSHAVNRGKFQDLAWKEKLRVLQGRRDSTSQWVQDFSPQVTKRNRYGNVQPWENSRIHLKVAEGELDYINASPISLHDPLTGVETKYIATQGPKQSGLSHFWHMIWQETNDVAVIVMLTQTHDGNTEKCFQYFPLDEEAGTFKIEPIDRVGGTPEGSVSFIECTPHPESKTDIRKLTLQFGTETKDVWHFLFSGWPDFAVPEYDDLDALMELLKLSTEKNGSPSNPRTIHCSAGVGRSGTYIALEHLLAQVDSGAVANAKDNEDMIYDVVNRMREQRMMMVQMDTQYQFLYDVVKEQYRQRQLASRAYGQHSPKLRKLASGMKATVIDENIADESCFHKEGIDEGPEDYGIIKGLHGDEHKVEDVEHEGQTPT